MVAPLRPIPTLSLNNWVSSGSAKADYVMARFFVSARSQTNVYRGNVLSLPYVFYRYASDPNTLTQAVEDALQTHLQRNYPEGVYVKCSHNANDPTNTTGKYVISVIAEISEGGVSKSMGRLVNVDGGKLVSILNMNNTGTQSSQPL